jgi:hypothetical protein
MGTKFMRLTVRKNFHAANIESAIVRPNNWLRRISPVGFRFIEIGHPINTDLHWCATVSLTSLSLHGHLTGRAPISACLIEILLVRCERKTGKGVKPFEEGQ